MSDKIVWPMKAGGFIATFAIGAAAAGGCFAAFASLMAGRGLPLAVAWPFALTSVCLGSMLSGWIFALIAGKYGLACGAAQGAVFAVTLLSAQSSVGPAPHGRQIAVLLMVMAAGTLGGLIRALYAGKPHHRRN